MIESLDDLTI